MSAMKPDAWMISDPDGELATAVTLRPQNPVSETGLVIDGLYTLATVRKWLEELSEKVIAAGTLFDMKDDLSDIGADAEGIFRAMLAAKLRELEGGE